MRWFSLLLCFLVLKIVLHVTLKDLETIEKDTLHLLALEEKALLEYSHYAAGGRKNIPLDNSMVDSITKWTYEHNFEKVNKHTEVASMETLQALLDSKDHWPIPHKYYWALGKYWESFLDLDCGIDNYMHQTRYIPISVLDSADKYIVEGIFSTTCSPSGFYCWDTKQHIRYDGTDFLYKGDVSDLACFYKNPAQHDSLHVEIQ